MSIATMNWALQQRLETPLHQILLYVIADSAAPDGTTRHCDPDYLVERARMSRASVFRKLADLRAWGLVETFTSQGARGAQIYEIRLQLKASVDMPMKSRKNSDDEGESHSETGSESGSGAANESHSETPHESHCETGAVAAERLGQSQSGDCISPPLSKESPPNPPPGGLGSDVVTEDDLPEARRMLLARFRIDYPLSSQWNWAKVIPIFALLTDAEAEHAAASASPYGLQTTKPKAPKPMRPDRFLRERMFENFPAHRKLPEAAPAACDPVWYPEDSPEVAALRVVCAITGEPMPTLWPRPEWTGLWLKRSVPLGPDLLTMARFDPQQAEDFDFVAEVGSGEHAAWRDRMSRWLARKVEWTRVWIEPLDPAVHRLPASDPRFRMRRSVTGFRVPWQWPPRKDGTLTQDDDGNSEMQKGDEL